MFHQPNSLILRLSIRKRLIIIVLCHLISCIRFAKHWKKYALIILKATIHRLSHSYCAISHVYKSLKRPILSSKITVLVFAHCGIYKKGHAKKQLLQPFKTGKRLHARLPILLFWRNMTVTALSVISLLDKITVLFKLL